jgi:uncharacterized coiled-coil protein SlyX
MEFDDATRIRELEERVVFLESEIERLSRCARMFERESVAKLGHLRASAAAYEKFIQRMVDHSPFQKPPAREPA